MLERTPPHNKEAERGLLGSIILAPDVLDDVTGRVQGADFYDPAHRVLFEALTSLYERGRQIDVTLLIARLRTANQLEQVGGAAGIAQISQSVANWAHAVSYANEVRRHALLRRLIDASADTLSDAFNAGDEDAAETVDRAERRMFEVQEYALTQADGEQQTLSQILQDTLAEIEARRSGTASLGIPTGFCDLDRHLGGWRAGNLIVIGGRPGQGKSALGMQVAIAAAQAGHHVLFFSLEMSSLELTERVLSQQAQLPLWRLRNGTLTNEQRRELVAAAGGISRLDLRIFDNANMTASRIAAESRRSRRRHGSDMVVIDYLQLMTPDNNRDPRQEQVSKMTRRLKLLARELQIPVLILAQVNRQSGDAERAPKLSELRESGAIEQDADVVIFVYRPQPPDNTPTTAQAALSQLDGTRAQDAELVIAKNRMGPTEHLGVHWLPGLAMFVPRADARQEAWAPDAAELAARDQDAARQQQIDF
jgi:replicative DNA helicase